MLSPFSYSALIKPACQGAATATLLRCSCTGSGATHFGHEAGCSFPASLPLLGDRANDEAGAMWCRFPVDPLPPRKQQRREKAGCGWEAGFVRQARVNHGNRAQPEITAIAHCGPVYLTEAPRVRWKSPRRPTRRPGPSSPVHTHRGDRRACRSQPHKAGPLALTEGHLAKGVGLRLYDTSLCQHQHCSGAVLACSCDC